MRFRGPLADSYPAAVALVVFALVPYLALTAALTPLQPILSKSLPLSPGRVPRAPACLGQSAPHCPSAPARPCAPGGSRGTAHAPCSAHGGAEAASALRGS